MNLISFEIPHPKNLRNFPHNSPLFQVLHGSHLSINPRDFVMILSNILRHYLVCHLKFDDESDAFLILFM